MSSGYTKNDLEKKNVTELRKISKNIGITKYAGVKKEMLILSIIKAQNKSSISPKRKSPKRKSSVKKSPKRKSSVKKSPKRKSSVKKSPKRKSSAKKSPKRKSSAKKSPKRKSSAKKSPKRKSSAKKSPKRKSSAKKSGLSDLKNMTIPELKKLMKKEKIISPNKGVVRKSDLIAVIIDYRTINSDIDEISFSSKSGGFSPKCGKKNKKCFPNACSAETGECLPVLTTGELYKSVEAKQKKLHGKDYYFDKNSGLVGKKEDVDEHLKYWNKSPSSRKLSSKRKSSLRKSPSSRKLSSKRKSQSGRRCDSKDNPLLCGKNKICSAKSGACVSDTTSYRKGKYVLDADGRLIIGSKDTIEKLQEILGGKVSPTDKIKFESSPSKHIQSKTDEDDVEISDLQQKLKELSKSSSKKSSSKKSSPSLKLGETQQDIYETFSKCLADLQ